MARRSERSRERTTVEGNILEDGLCGGLWLRCFLSKFIGEKITDGMFFQ